MTVLVESADPHLSPTTFVRFEPLLPCLSDGAADAGAEVPTDGGQITLIWSAGTLCDVGELGGVPLIRIEVGEFALTCREEPPGRVDDTSPNRGSNTGAADNVPVGVGIDPDPS